MSQSKATSSDCDYRPAFQAVGLNDFTEDNNFFYEDYSQRCSLVPKQEVENDSDWKSSQEFSQKYNERFRHPDFYPPLPPAPPPSQDPNQDGYDYQHLHSGEHFPPVYEEKPEYLDLSDQRINACLLLQEPFAPDLDWAPPQQEEQRETLFDEGKRQKMEKKKRKSQEFKKAKKKKSEQEIKKEPAEEQSNDAEEAAKERRKEEKRERQKKKYVPRQGIAEWDAQHRKEYQSYTKGMVLIRCDDVDSESFGKELWLVDSYHLVQKYVLESEDTCLGIKVFARTDRFSGWMADEPWSYYHLRTLIVGDDLQQIEVSVFPTRDTIRDFSLTTKFHHPFYQELLERLKEDGETRKKEKENGQELEEEDGGHFDVEGDEAYSDFGQDIKTEPYDEEEDDLLNIDKTKLFFYGKSRYLF